MAGEVGRGSRGYPAESDGCPGLAKGSVNENVVTRSSLRSRVKSYLKGDFLPNSGLVRVTVTPKAATVDYVRTQPPTDRPAGQAGTVAHTYTIAAKPR